MNIEKKLLLITSLFCLSIAWTAGQGLEQLIDREITTLVKTYHHLHTHPELSYYESETAGYLARELRSLGFEVTEKVGRYENRRRTSYGVVGVLKNGDGPTVMLRTDLDALPVTEETGVSYASRVRVRDEAGEEVGVMHACGHDIHMTSWLGAARILKELRSDWQGTLVLIAQPAEERGAGARAMLVDGLYTRFPKPDVVLALHVGASLEAGRLGYRSEYALASVDSVDLTVRGRGGHGAFPHTTKDPVVLAAQIVLALQTIVSREISPLDPAVVTVGSIHGGTKHNIIPNEVHLQLTVRSYKPEVRRHILDAIQRVSEGVAAASGIPRENWPSVTVNEEEFTPATYNDPRLIERLLPVLQQALGKDNVVEVEPVMGGEDFSRYSRDGDVPACIFWLGAVDPALMEQHRTAGVPLPSLHSSQFAPLPEPTLRGGITALTASVLHLMAKKE